MSADTYIEVQYSSINTYGNGQRHPAFNVFNGGNGRCRCVMFLLYPLMWIAATFVVFTYPYILSGWAGDVTNRPSLGLIWFDGIYSEHGSVCELSERLCLLKKIFLPVFIILEVLSLPLLLLRGCGIYEPQDIPCRHIWSLLGEFIMATTLAAIFLSYRYYLPPFITYQNEELSLHPDDFLYGLIIASVCWGFFFIFHLFGSCRGS